MARAVNVATPVAPNENAPGAPLSSSNTAGAPNGGNYGTSQYYHQYDATLWRSYFARQATGSGWPVQAEQSHGAGTSTNAQSPQRDLRGYITSPTINPYTGEPDYTAQWAEYYRAIGLHVQASVIEARLREGRNTTTAASAYAPSPPADPTPTSFSNQCDQERPTGHATGQHGGYPGGRTQNFPARGRFHYQQ